MLLFSPHVFSPKHSTPLFSLPYVPRAPYISLFMIQSPEKYFVRTMGDEISRYFRQVFRIKMGHAVVQWLGHWATYRKVAGSIPDGVIRIFHLHNPFSRTMALGSTQPPTEMSTRNISWEKGGRCVGLTTLPPSFVDCLEIWEPHSPGTLRACLGLLWDCFTVTLLDSTLTDKRFWTGSRNSPNWMSRCLLFVPYILDVVEKTNNMH
jgi:hypothetical protein